MEKNIANKDNFYMGTKANFRGIKTPKREPDYISCSGSEYWYAEKGVIRKSNHWCDNIRSCSWKLNGEDCNELKSGFCKWEDFELQEEKVEVVVYVKNHEFFDKFEYEGSTACTGNKYFIFNPTFNDIRNNRIFFMGRSCAFIYDDMKTINFDF